MKHLTAIFLLSILAFAANGQNNGLVTLAFDSSTYRFGMPLNNPMTSLTITNDTPKQPDFNYRTPNVLGEIFACRLCKKQFQPGDAFVLYVTNVYWLYGGGTETEASYAHYLCTVKPKKKP